MITDNRKPEWYFYPGWVVLSVISFLVAWATCWALISQVEKVVGDTMLVRGQTHITEDFLLTYMYFPVLGLLDRLSTVSLAPPLPTANGLVDCSNGPGLVAGFHW